MPVCSVCGGAPHGDIADATFCRACYAHLVGPQRRDQDTALGDDAATGAKKKPRQAPLAAYVPVPSVTTTLPNGVTHITHAPGNLSLYYVPNLGDDAALREALMAYVNTVTYLPKVGRSMSSAPYPFVSRNFYRWETEIGNDVDQYAFYNFNNMHHNPLPPHPMGAVVRTLKQRCVEWARQNMASFDDSHIPNAVLINYYPNGGVGLSAHGDNDVFYGGDAVSVLSYSLGAERSIKFSLRVPGAKTNPEVVRQKMTSGSLLVMDGVDVQTKYTHEVTSKKPAPSVPPVGPRWNFTFRRLIPALFEKQHARVDKNKSRPALEAMYAAAYQVAAANAVRPDGQPPDAEPAVWARQWWAAVDAGF